MRESWIYPLEFIKIFLKFAKQAAISVSRPWDKVLYNYNFVTPIICNETGVTLNNRFEW